MPQIRFKSGPQTGHMVDISGDKPLVIGREGKADLQVSDKGVSRDHAEIYRVGEMVFIRDLGSRNGTYVNGELAQEELLRHGDLIQIGNTQLLFESTRKARAGEPGVEFQEGAAYKTSVELRLDELLSDSRVWTGHGESHFRALCQATSLIYSERDEQRLFEALLDLLLEHLPADHLYVFLRGAGGAITARAARQRGEAGGVPVSRTILKRALSEARAILTADARQDERFRTGDSIVIQHIRSVLCTPIPGPAGVMGALYAVHTEVAESFDQGDLEMLVAIGAQLGNRLGQTELLQTRQRQLLALVARLLRLRPQQGAEAVERAERVAGYAAAIAREMGLLDSEMLQTQTTGLLCDLTDPELELLAGVPGLEAVLDGLRARAERFDGSGAPKGLKGDALPVMARIAAVASEFERLFRAEAQAAAPERTGALLRQAFTALEQASGRAFDPQVVRALVIAHRHGALAVSMNGARRQAEAAATAAAQAEKAP